MEDGVMKRPRRIKVVRCMVEERAGEPDWDDISKDARAAVRRVIRQMAQEARRKKKYRWKTPRKKRTTS